MKMTYAVAAPLRTPSTCPVFVIFMILYSLIVRHAVLTDLNLIPSLTNRCIPRWS